MARILFTWELGDGSGHTTPYLGLIDRLEAAGHEVSFALRFLHNADRQFRGRRTRVYQAPYMLARHTAMRLPVDSYATVLNNSGYDSVEHLAALVTAWRNLFEHVAPDLLVFDYSPTAMLASRDSAARRLAIGTGFHLPPRQTPLPGFRGDAGADAVRQERRVLEIVNAVLARDSLPPLACLADLLAVDRTLLRTLPALDHYDGRGKSDYIGILPAPAGAEPEWPPLPGPKVFAYLKGFQTLPDLLTHLNERRYPTIVRGDNLDADIAARFASPSLRFASAPLDMARVGASADVAIGNGTHGTSAELLLAGVPQLLLPLYAEQELVARAVERLGAGLAAPRRLPQPMAAKLDALLREPGYRDSARAFAERDAAAGRPHPTDAMLEAIEALLAASN